MNLKQPIQISDERVDEIADSFRITKTTPRNRFGGGGTWVTGTMGGHKFEALVFPEHAEFDWCELDDSKISKLLVRDGRGATVAHFERGWDVEPTNDEARAIVDLLAAGLAETVFDA